MRKALHFIPLLLVSGALQAQQVVISQDFESLTHGQGVAQGLGLPWTTWSNAPGGSEDATASNLYAHGGNMSAAIVANAVGGGPTDFVVRLGTRTTGHYGLSWWMYIPSGKGAYFNLQKTEAPGTSWAIEVEFPADGSIGLSDNMLEGSVLFYPSGQWFKVEIDIDLDSQAGMLSLDGEDAAFWTTSSAAGDGDGLNQLGGVDFFAYAGGNDLGEYYIDDFEFVSYGTLGVPEIVPAGTQLYPNPTEATVHVDLAGASPDAEISLVDVTGRVVIPQAPLSSYGRHDHVELDLTEQPQGLYFVRITDRGRETIHRVAKY